MPALDLCFRVIGAVFSWPAARGTQFLLSVVNIA
jgi:hypothetical protein